MSKTNKKKGKKKKHANTKKRNTSQQLKAKKFFKKIGIQPLHKASEGQISHILRDRFGHEVADTFWKKYEEGTQDHLYFMHTNLELAKLKCGNDFDILCDIATELSKLPVSPKSRVLDIGGGCGHLAFWMANNWNTAEVTVTDLYPHLGEQWANEIGENRVKFVNATLPGLNIETDQKYDVIIMSRVLDFIDELDILKKMEDFSTEEYFIRDNVKMALDVLESIAAELYTLLTSDSLVVIINHWADFRVLAVCRAFERQNLFLNLKYFSPEQVSAYHSMIVFSKAIDPIPVQDLPLGLSTKMNFTTGPLGFAGVSADSFRKFFNNVVPVVELEYVTSEDNITIRNELREKEGIALLYRSSNDGKRMAWVYPGIAIPEIMMELNKMRKRLISENAGIVIKSIMPCDTMTSSMGDD